MTKKGFKYPIDKYPNFGFRGKKHKSSKFPVDKYPNFGMRGKHHTEETKSKCREASKNQIHSEESKKKVGMKTKERWNFPDYKKRMSDIHKKNWQNPIFREHRKFTEETKTQISNSIKKYFENNPKEKNRLIEFGIQSQIYWNSPIGQLEKKKRSDAWLGNKNPNYEKEFSRETKDKLRQARLKQILPSKNTSIEIKLQKALDKLNIEFKKHKSLLGLTQCDLFIEPNIVIFTDGCYWHACEKCFDRNKFNSMQRKRKVSDLLITQKLIKEGFRVLRFWEHDISKNFEDKVLDEIIFTVRENKNVKST